MGCWKEGSAETPHYSDLRKWIHESLEWNPS